MPLLALEGRQDRRLEGSERYGEVSDVIRTTTSAVLARTKTPDEGVGEMASRLRRTMR